MVPVAAGFDLPRCLNALAAIQNDVNNLVSVLTPVQFHAPPRGGGWSVAYCIEHLALTGNEFLPHWDCALKKALPNVTHGPSSGKYRWWRRGLLQFVEPPYRVKTKTAHAFLPAYRHSMEDTLDRFRDMHREFAKRLEKSAGLDVNRTRVQSPFASWISYPLGFSFDLALAHERRHLWQAWQVRRQIIDDQEAR